ncbi:hypothetical protein [Hymenobacter norwichensis]|uniref:hypothetical protein n=1 Tax=Hymenobacter norwichensis TaxID=223903 RepID=UPI0003B37620|nr:hypothetical protein [Hymenobacter norwichensis]
MIQLYDDDKGKADSCEATLIDPEALGTQLAYGLGATPQLAVENLKQAIEQRIALLQAIDYSQISLQG